MKRVHVVAGVIYGEDGRILIACRPIDTHKGGLWEFPGGKLDPGETPREALVRELREELAIEVVSCEPLTEIRHDYPEKSVLLDFWSVTEFRGEPAGNEGQPIEWVTLASLVDYQFPEANQTVVELLLESSMFDV